MRFRAGRATGYDRPRYPAAIQLRDYTMAETQGRALSEVLDRLEAAVQDSSVTVSDIMDHLGAKSFGALILVPALLAASPASAIPGLTTAVALIVALMVVQMLIGRDHAWLPGWLARRRIASKRICQAVGWLRPPVAFVERFLRPRLTFLVRRPFVYVPLLVCLAITVFMPVMEVIPTSGSIASAAIAIFAAALLTRDGLLVLVALLPLMGIPLLIWQIGGF